ATITDTTAEQARIRVLCRIGVIVVLGIGVDNLVLARSDIVEATTRDEFHRVDLHAGTIDGKLAPVHGLQGVIVEAAPNQAHVRLRHATFERDNGFVVDRRDTAGAEFVVAHPDETTDGATCIRAGELPWGGTAELTRLA